MPAENRFEWNDAAIARLRQFWSEGLSTSEIGRRLGCSKNAVVGKAHRIDLPGRPSPVRQTSDLTPRPGPRRMAVPRLADIMPVRSLARTADVPPPVRQASMAARTPKPLATMRITVTGQSPCCWPMGEPGAPGFRFCEAPALVSRPYCGQHAALAYVPPRDRRAKTGPSEATAMRCRPRRDSLAHTAVER